MRLKSRTAVLAVALIFVPWAALPVRAQTRTNFQAEFQTGQDALDRGDFRTAYRVFRSLAEEGFAKAQYDLALMYRKGKIVPRNNPEAVKWFHKAAEQGHVQAQVNLGKMYLKGRGVPENYILAHMWFNLAAARGDPDSRKLRAGIAGKMTPALISEAQRLASKWKPKLSPATMGAGFQANFQDAMSDYRRGNYPAAFWKFLLLSEQGYAAAENNLGAMYESGIGARKDPGEAKKWYRKAAEQGYAAAQNNLGVMFGQGKGVQPDYREAVKWYRKGAEQGYDLAQYNLGVMYAEGKGVLEDPDQAMKWYRKAAEQGNARAQNNLAEGYALGVGVKRNSGRALKLYREAAEQGLAQAQHSLAIMYGKGEGVGRNDVHAHMWSTISMANGVADAQEVRDVVAQRMTFTQIEKAQRLAAEWKPKR
jgi:TPR repeat protein